MPLDNRLSKRLNNNKFVIPFCFTFSVILMVTGIVLLRIVGIPNIPNVDWVFNVSADLVCMAIGIAILISIVIMWRTSGNYNRVFVLLLTTAMFAMFLDELSWLVEGKPEFWVVSLIANVLNFCTTGSVLYFFWAYIVYALDLQGKTFRTLDIIMYVAYGVHTVLALVNFFYPLYFKIDPSTGIYTRSSWGWWLSQIQTLITLVGIVIALIASKAPIRTKLVVGTFLSIPLLTIALTQFRAGLTTHLSGIFIAIVFVYCIVFTEHEKVIATTEEELGLATKIQYNMLPTIFPAFPERQEFDLFALMNPAKEVGGDFYDFFLVDEDHLGVVIADVSGKGVPAALFMMASKILVQNTVMNGKGPKDALETINNRISNNNLEDMFLTIWLGVLNVKTGILEAANAGHEYPAIQKANGKFDVIRDKHGFVIGGMPGLKYTQYSIKLEKGDKLFLYTDGVTEATNIHKELFGEKRMVESLRSHQDGGPKEIVEGVRQDIASFVGSAPQFDDITMLCLTFKGKD